MVSFARKKSFLQQLKFNHYFEDFLFYFLGDFDPENLKKGSDHVVCVGEVHDFTEAFLFSLETQHTIG